MSKAGAGAAPGRKAGVGIGGLLLTAGVAALVVSGALIASGPALFRAGVLDLHTATRGVEEVAVYVLGGAGLAGLAGLSASLLAKSHRGVIVAVLVLLAAAIGLGTLYGQSVIREQTPPIYDVQTDWTRPVAFTEKALQAREADGAVQIRDDAMVPMGEGRWAGMSFANAQADFYRDLKPLFVNAPPPEATVAVARAAKRLGWDVMLSDPPGGAVEAVHRSRWYGLASDISVRVTPEGGGSRIDARSTSRMGEPDMGLNASLIKQLLDEVAFALRGG